MNKWTLHVENFGKLKQAEICVSPLNFFIGDNNSGKSYLMTLFYGLLTLSPKSLFGYPQLSEEEMSWTKEYIKKLTKSSSQQMTRYNLEDIEIERLFVILNKCIDANKKQIVLELFNEEVNIDKIYVEYDKSKQYQLVVEDDFITNEEERTLILYEYGESSRRGIILGNKINISDFDAINFLTMVFIYLLRDEICDPNDEIFYIPTTRTGFVLTYSKISKEAVEQVYTVSKEEKRNKNALTKPSVDFLKFFGGLVDRIENPNKSDLITFIDNKLIEGTVKTDELSVKNIRYVTKWDDKDMPLHVTSGVVTEAVPIDVIIRYTNAKVVFYEEPEISMHPQLQQQMARLLIRMANSGMIVFATTHSDIIMQHVNNMLRIDRAKRKTEILEKLDYDVEDIINKDRINVFQFKNHSENNIKPYSDVKKLESGENGFALETFYDVLIMIGEEIETIEDMQ